MTAAAVLLNVKLVLHPKNVPIVHGKNTAVGIRCNARVTLSLRDNLLQLLLLSPGALELFAN